MMTSLNGLLVAMILSYAIVIYALIGSLQKHSTYPSISHLLCEEHVWTRCMIGTLCMAFFTMAYESHRPFSTFVPITFMFAGIIGLLTFPVSEQVAVHYGFAALVFVSILAWMMCATHYFANVASVAMVSIQVFVFSTIVLMTLCNDSIFVPEIAYVSLFALSYLSCHFRC